MKFDELLLQQLSRLVAEPEDALVHDVALRYWATPNWCIKDAHAILGREWNGLIDAGVTGLGNSVPTSTPMGNRLEGTAKCLVDIRTFEGDIDKIEIYNPVRKSFVALYSTQPTYTSGLSRWEHAEYLPPQDHSAAATERMRSAGLPLPGVELRIADEQGEEIPLGEVGDILIRSPMTMAGYWRRDDETRNAINPEGWLRTGDAGFVDADGYLFIQDRLKDMIISGGENIYPAELESVLFAHPDISDVAIIGVPDARWGEAVKAIVVLEPGAATTADEIIAFASGELARFKVPKSVDFVPVLPRNASGKILRRELRAPFWPQGGRQIN